MTITTVTYDKSLELLKVHLAEYRPQLEKALAAVKVLETAPRFRRI